MKTRKKWIRIASFLMAFIMFFMPSTDVFALGTGANAYSSSAPGKSYRYLGQRLYLVAYKPSKGDTSIGVRDWLCSKNQKVIAINRKYMTKTIGNSEERYNEHTHSANGNFGEGTHTYKEAYPKIEKTFGEEALKTMKRDVAEGYHYAVVLEGWGAYAGKGKLKYTPAGAIFYYTFKGGKNSPWKKGASSWYHLCHFKNKDLAEGSLADEKYGLAPSLRNAFHLVTAVPKVPGGKGCNPRWVYDMLWDTMNTSYYDPLSGKSTSNHIRGYVVYTFKEKTATNKAEVSLRIYDHDEAGNWNSQARSYGEAYQIEKGTSANYFAQAVTNAYTSMDNKKLTRNEAYHKGTERGVKTALMPKIDCKLGDAGIASQPKTSAGYILMQADGTPLVSIGKALAGAEEKKRDYRVWFKSTDDAKVTTETTPLELQGSIGDDTDADSDAGSIGEDMESASKLADAEASEADTVDDGKDSPDKLGKQTGEYDDDDDIDTEDGKDSSIKQGTATEDEITNTPFAKDTDAINSTNLEEEAEAEKENAAEVEESNLLTIYETASGTPFGHKWVAQGIKSSNSESDTLYNSSNIWKLFQKNANSIDGASPCVGGKSKAGGSATLYQASLNSTSLELKRLSNDFTKDNYKKTFVKDGTYKIGTSSKYRYMQDKVHYFVYTITADTQRIDLQTSFTGDVTIKKKEYTGTSVGFTNIKDVPAGSKVIAVSNVDTDKKAGEKSLIEGTSDVKNHAKSVTEIYNWLQGLASKQYTVPNSGGKKANLGESKAVMQTSNGTLSAGCADNFAGDYASGNVGYTFVVFKTNEVKTESGEGLQDYELNRYFPSAFTVEQYDALNNGLGSVFKTYQPSESEVTWSHHGLDHKHNIHEHDHVHSRPDGHGGSITFTVHNHDSNPDDWVSAPVEFKYSGSTKAQDYDKKGNKGQFIARYDHCDTAHGLMKYSGDYPYTTAKGRVIDLTQTSPYQFDWGHMLARNMAGDKRTVSSLAYTSKEESGEGFKVGSELSKALELEYGDTAKTTSGASAKRNSSAIASGGTWDYTFNFTAKHLHEGAYKPKVKRCFSYTTCSWCGAVVCNRGCDTGEVTVDFNLNEYYTLNGGARASWAPKLHMTVRKYLEESQEIGVSPTKDGIQSRLESSGGSFKHSVDKLAQNKTASRSNEFGYVYYENYGDSSIGTKDITDKFVPEVLMRVEKATGDFTNAEATGIWTMGEKERNTKPIAFYLFKIKNDDSKAASGKTRGNTAATGNSANGNNRATYTTGSDISIKAKVKAKGYMYGYALDQISTNEDNEDKSKWTGTSYNIQIPSGKLPTWGNNNIDTLKNDFTDWVKKVSDKKNYQADFVMSIKKSGGSPIRYNGFSASLGKFSKPVSDGDGVKYTNAYPLTFRFGELQTEDKAGAGYRAMIDQIKKDYGDTTGTECSEATAKRIFKDSGIEQAIFDSVQSAKASTNKSQNGAGHNTNLGAGNDRTGVTDNGKFLTKSRTLGTKDHWYDEAVRTFVVRRFTTDKPLDFGTVMATDKVDYDNADDSGNSTHDAWFNFNLYFNYNKGDNKIRGIKQLFRNKSDFYDRKGSVADNASKTKNVIINNTFVDGSEFNITSTTTNSMGW